MGGGRRARTGRRQRQGGGRGRPGSRGRHEEFGPRGTPGDLPAEGQARPNYEVTRRGVLVVTQREIGRPRYTGRVVDAQRSELPFRLVHPADPRADSSVPSGPVRQTVARVDWL